MDDIQMFKKANFCVKNLVNRLVIHQNVCFEFDFFNPLGYSPRINRDTLNILLTFLPETWALQAFFL